MNQIWNFLPSKMQEQELMGSKSRTAKRVGLFHDYTKDTPLRNATALMQSVKDCCESKELLGFFCQEY